MMRPRLLAPAALLFLWTSVALPQTAPPPPSVPALIRNQVAPQIAAGRLIGAVTLVARDGEILDLQAHGLADRESARPMTTDTIFRIHSCTKAITSAAALMLFEEGKFQFDDPVSLWIPAFGELRIHEKDGTRPAQEPLRIRHLLTHTSGISYRKENVFSAGDNAAVAEAIARSPLEFEPGQGWTYGSSTDVLGRLVEIWSGQRINAFFAERIFQPLGMKDTAFFVPTEKRARLATLYQEQKGSSGLHASEESGLQPGAVPDQLPVFRMPGGGLYSTARDYYRFLQMIQNGGELDGTRLLRTSSVALMTTNQVPEGTGWIRFGKEVRDGFGFGFGFNVVAESSRWDPDAKPGEFGWGGAASCHYWMHPDHRLIVITLEQTMPYRWTLERALKGPLYDAFSPP
jgi:CubicO group peptidase (beta-lactamase class C family)